MLDTHGAFHAVHREYLTTLERVLRECGKRYGLDDLELRDVRGLGFDGSRIEVWWTREDHLVGWCELRMEMKGERLVYTINGGKPSV